MVTLFFLELTSYYDDRGRMAQSAAQSHLDTGATDYVTNTYNFPGELLTSKREHKASTSGTVTTLFTKNEYDHAGRLNRITKVSGSQTQTPLQSYTYTYDKLNRLKKAAYSATNKVNHYNEELAYDVMGNIDTLRRTRGGTGWYNHFKYSYTGNKLNAVSDIGTANRDNSFIYDANGNARTNTRLGITDIAYNYLNLPTKFVQGSQQLVYLYDATGRKLKKTLGSAVTDYVEGIQYKNGVLEFIQTEEGRILPSGSSFVYEYFLKDHLGNTRAIVDHTGAVKQIQDYYAFGMEMNTGAGLNSASNHYKYNGKEKQVELGLDQLDYGARFYDAEIGRWNVVAPLADEFENVSPYNYAMNNPILMIDPDGMAADTSGFFNQVIETVVVTAKKATDYLTSYDFAKSFGDIVSGGQVSDMEYSLYLYETEGMQSYIYSQVGSAYRDNMYSMRSWGISK